MERSRDHVIIEEMDRDPEKILEEITNTLALIRRAKRNFTPKEKEYLRGVLQTALNQEELK
jgi:hypothetical protein